MYSYHIFYFPFKWENSKSKSCLFFDQTDLDTIEIEKYSNWLRNPGTLNDPEGDELYNEKNYYYPFVHPVLYDENDKDTLLHHYERKEPQLVGNNVYYKISTHGKEYTLNVDGITLNLYSTGVGTLIFYLKNERDDQQEPDDILKINQFGRRIFPPFMADIEKRWEIANSISIDGLNGDSSKYFENFSTYTNKKDWQPACFIKNLIDDLSPDLTIFPVIDDRMFVNCWYGNKKLADSIIGKSKEELDECFRKEHFWYKFIYVDVSNPTCKNDEMHNELMQKQTYKRWQKDGMLYGSSRYSFVLLSPDSEDFHKKVIAVYMRTTYSRMVELILVQRASILKFSKEVTHVSKLSKADAKDQMIIKQISSLYEEYIRFVNQVHFREVTAQDQGIELYKLMMETLDIPNQIKDLDKELEELHQYASFVEDRERNRKADILNFIAAVFLPATLFAGIFGMNSVGECGKLSCTFWLHIGIVAVATLIMYCGIKLIKKKGKS